MRFFLEDVVFGDVNHLVSRSTNTMYELPPTIVDGTLWTDRYRPKKFTDLLGDEVSLVRRILPSQRS